MKTETAMSKAAQDNYRNLAASMAKHLSRRGHVPFYAATAAEALEKVLELIPAGASVGIPGSVTIREIGAVEALQERGHKVVQHWDPKATAAEKLEARFEEAQCDVFLVSSNAITKDGVLVNIDGSGNRVAAMCWSRGDRIYVVGMNKVCPDVESALARVRDRVAPPNAQRLSSSGRSVAPDSICRAVLIMEQAPTMPDGKKSYVVLVGEELGY
ncbi:lactate utilization protein [Pyramidobacter sp. SM-530-WT-4B]|uniref:Lactate utilization protein n=1 Tax=Pyramidobacter porci TaxID=2605789 RepID=A0A6L5YBZ3_9BACT|nr:lactate utilization protein [Pyramidobacter porci]MCI6260242.1 lactate utilization protein [Pyramidobacter sp.]MST55067.1 lactate utilization protein [Pyramidobacter porci]